MLLGIPEIVEDGAELVKEKVDVLKAHAAALVMEVKPVETDGRTGDAIAFFIVHGSDGGLIFITDDGLVTVFLDEGDGMHLAVSLRSLFEVELERLCVCRLGAE